MSEKKVVEVETLDGIAGVVDEAEFTGGVLPDVKPLTRGEIKRLRKLGLDPTTLSGDPARSSDFTDWVLDNVYAGTDFDDVPFGACLALVTATVDTTYGKAPEVKNS